MASIPNTLSRSSHALTIKAAGVNVGMINGWNPAQGRTITPIYEIGEDDSGNPKECMPGNISGMTISISRFDVYTKKMEEAFGTPDLVMLTRQSEPFDIIERWVIPVRFGSSVSVVESEERYIYTGCWFSSIGRTIRSDDNRIINVNANLIYTKKQKVTGVASGVLA